MCLLFETIRIVNGEPQNLSLHEKRMNFSRKRLFGADEKTELSDLIRVPENYRSGVIRCRVIYGSSVISVEFTDYRPAQIKSLKLVNAGNLDYNFKYLDRRTLAELADRKIADDILIVKDGCITDTSFANIVFTNGKEWITPDTPLLPGTMREKLLAEGVIRAERITSGNLSGFTHFRLINAMLAFNSQILDVKNIL